MHQKLLSPGLCITTGLWHSRLRLQCQVCSWRFSWHVSVGTGLSCASSWPQDVQRVQRPANGGHACPSDSNEPPCYDLVHSISDTRGHGAGVPAERSAARLRAGVKAVQRREFTAELAWCGMAMY